MPVWNWVIRHGKNLLRSLHLIPDGEQLSEQRLREALLKQQVEEERMRKVLIGQEVRDKVRRGDDDAPETPEEFVSEVERRRRLLADIHDVRARKDNDK